MLRLPTFTKAVRLASQLTILDQATATFRTFIPNDEQCRVLRALLDRDRVIVGKGRQTGTSTISLLVLMLVALMNPGLPCCVVADEQEKAEGLLLKVKQWLAEIGIILLVDNVRSITLENGSTIDARTSRSRAEDGESRVGRSKSYGFIHASEQSFWMDAITAWASLTSTALGGMRCVVESTGVPGESLFRKILEADDPAWERVFIGVEEHVNYRLDPASISEATWDSLKAEHGFTRRDSAAWWHAKLHGDMRGNVSKCLQEFPVAQRHMFTHRIGLHIERYVEAPVSVDDTGMWNYYAKPILEPLILSVDTSAGVGLDASALAVLGQMTGRLYATWRHNLTPIPAFQRVVRDAIGAYAPAAIIVETNGVGAAVYQGLLGIRGLVEQHSSGSHARGDGELHIRRDETREALETGAIPVGGHLLEEVQSSSVDKHGKFIGKDDVISAVSFALKWRKANPFRVGEPPVDRLTTFVAPKFKKARRW